MRAKDETICKAIFQSVFNRPPHIEELRAMHTWVSYDVAPTVITTALFYEGMTQPLPQWRRVCFIVQRAHSLGARSGADLWRLLREERQHPTPGDSLSWPPVSMEPPNIMR